MEGGVYLDTDVNCFKRIDDLLDGVNLFVSDERAIEPEWAACPGNYMFGAEKGSPAMWTVVRELTGNLRKLKGQENPVLTTGPRYLQDHEVAEVDEAECGGFASVGEARAGRAAGVTVRVVRGGSACDCAVG